ncbi:tRNA (adenosine(37)-N6)-threonylcarbamoyltransferase complex dimerization subunit type 1 TsaB [Stenotrophomonas sp. 364]|jgi:tRNA threonylcarbamoyladenosine biosynthesis protein TsaB|uniref:tRNA (adenosine(37)-N6)-threonylcarbamoyltransferase complex dimerization subunit type 1 TsaB n=1 Tax=Stenotrophomonas sp. 364 TaxID=2691571 RepID=UPI0013192734|nr:tRNA (adenosine(37)-N6)-threonylcarbamoyltransferase complex dimerization subunit type 1 TsaB [Stenotrophomonas sp. 364]QHB72399.1 tRNA (adenosine(37)-N6)-threonylcarbamoyltransferase complex dimerization subunit type 1 TsaB [Stenotrophomonas sp. 364]
MKLLAFETATEACSVALYVDGQVLERFEIAPRRHAELSLPWAEALLAEAGVARSQLDAIALGRGPGAFTGVRLAIAIAQGIALALDRPLVPVSTLQVLALRAPAGADLVLSSIDARMGEVYVARQVRVDGQWQLRGEEIVCAPEAVVLPEGTRWFGVGTGFGAADGLLATRLADQLDGVDAQALPRASDLLTLAVPAFARGEGMAPERVEPAYLRNNVALTLVEQHAARAAKTAR